MAILTHSHLFAQADRLVSLFPERKPRQTELRRAVPAAYCGIYHFVSKQAADEYVGARYGKRFPPAPQYVLAYRSISHTALYTLCSGLKKPDLSEKVKAASKSERVGSDLRGFATLLVDLQERRHTADYDISVAFNRAGAVLAIALARTAVERFAAVPAVERRVFLALLLFPARGTS